ncbi:MAG: histidinol-phosphate transaminase [Victivallaceae bacterium]|nr:histidinol-phosphate transaminase [Victivallaceae bacterium]
MKNKNYFRKAVADMAGYTPGEQPSGDIIKINTNENPYPPSPAVTAAINGFQTASLRRYPSARADGLRDLIAEMHGVKRENVIAGNGSDDLLTMITRAFVSPELPMACLDPTYTLYRDLAAMQEAKIITVELEPETFALPENLLEQAKGANLLMIPRPNAPTGNTFPLDTVEQICRGFDGMVLIDEAYADFAADNCMRLAATLQNVIVMRTLSKSYSLAGMRAGYAVAAAPVIAGLMKLKDSYNLDAVAQAAAAAALCDRDYFNGRINKIKETRSRLTGELEDMGFIVVPSSTNFVFTRPPKPFTAKAIFEFLRDRLIFVRFFDRERTRDYLRISVGTDDEMAKMLAAIREFMKK